MVLNLYEKNHAYAYMQHLIMFGKYMI